MPPNQGLAEMTGESTNSKQTVQPYALTFSTPTQLALHALSNASRLQLGFSPRFSPINGTEDRRVPYTPLDEGNKSVDSG